jgi:hypothetical protein
MAMQRDPVREWREQYARWCLDVDFEPSPSAAFYASVKPIFPELHITQAALSPGFLFRDDDLIRDGNDSFEFIVAQSGKLNVTQQGRDIRLGTGDATIMQASRPVASARLHRFAGQRRAHSIWSSRLGPS